MSRHIVVIGGGPAGIEAAAAAARSEACVTLVSDGPLGGRAGWTSLLPSKVWISAADLLGDLRAAEALGLADLPEPRLEPATVLARIKAVARAWSQHQARRIEALGVALATGVASFLGPGRLAVAAEGQAPAVLEADAVIIAAGSVPRFPPAMRPDGKRIIAPRFVGTLGALPPDIVVVGGGATGSEFASLFCRLGVRVTWLVGEQGVLPLFAAAAGERLAQALVERRAEVRGGSNAERVEQDDDGVTVVTADGERHRAAMAFLAIGRTPDLARLNLAAVGLAPEPEGLLAVDPYGRTAAPGVYAVGDTAGGPMLANRAMAQAWIAGRHAAALPVEPYCPETVIHAVYTNPEVAQVGRVGGPAEKLAMVSVPFTAGLKAHLLPGGEGQLDLAYDPATRQVAGAVAVGPHAADVLAPVALAIQTGATLEQLAAVFAANPAITELAFIAARSV